MTMQDRFNRFLDAIDLDQERKNRINSAVGRLVTFCKRDAGISQYNPHIFYQGSSANASNIQIVCDNLNTHFLPSFNERFSAKEAARVLSRIEFPYTPKHASWLDMPAIELSILSRTAIKDRVPNEAELVSPIKPVSKQA